MVPQVLAANNINLEFRGDRHNIVLKYLQHPRVQSFMKGIRKRQTTSDYDIYLHFENVQGRGVVPPIDVYLNVQDSYVYNSKNYAGSLALFGLEESSTPNKEHDGSGQHHLLEISQLLSGLLEQPGWSDDELQVTLKLSAPLPDGVSFTIGRISLSVQV